MNKNQKILFIVESPTKVKTIQKFLPSNYIVEASMGHVRQLEPKPNAFSLDNNQLTCKWITNDVKIKKILEISKKVNKIILATDPDREGEAISYHLLSILQENNINTEYERVCFNEITKSAIENGLKESRTLNDALVNAYFTRVVLDHAMGFILSPVLWSALKPFGHKQSAGRVQSVALRLIAERGILRQKFNSHKYFTIQGTFENKKHNITSLLEIFNNNNKVEFDENEANSILEKIKCNKIFKVIDIHIDKRKISPQEPFMTTTLQQVASRKLNMKINEVMMNAQKLYELGLITYHRSDSTTMSENALKILRNYIQKNYKECFSIKVVEYNKKQKNAQEAHECIRPSDIEVVTHNELTNDQQQLYTLIRNRALESQMKQAEFEYTTYSISCDNNAIFKIRTTKCLFASYNILYDFEYPKTLELFMQEEFNLNKIEKIEHETQPPKRFTESSIVKELEIYGIGRPSTMANIFETLKTREYITYSGRSIDITFKGLCVSTFLTLFFPEYINCNFTSEMEKKLDEVLEGINFIPMLQNIVTDLTKKTSNIISSLKTTNMNDIYTKIGEIILINKCEKCNGILVLKCKYQFYSECELCKHETNLQIEIYKLTENAAIINTGKYRYISIGELRIYLPNCINNDITENQIEMLSKLPYKFTHNNREYTVNKTVYNFFIVNDKKQYFNFDDFNTLYQVLNFNEQVDNVNLINFICKDITIMSKRKEYAIKDININADKKKTVSKNTIDKKTKSIKSTKTALKKTPKE